MLSCTGIILAMFWISLLTTSAVMYAPIEELLMLYSKLDLKKHVFLTS